MRSDVEGNGVHRDLGRELTILIFEKLAIDH